MDVKREKQRILDFVNTPASNALRVSKWMDIAREACHHVARPAFHLERVEEFGGSSAMVGEADLVGSWFGHVNVAGKSERWPIFSGKPMTPLLQVDCTALPFHPGLLKDIEMLTVFGSHLKVDSRQLHKNLENGASWLVRSYSSRNELRPLPRPAGCEFVETEPERYTGTWKTREDQPELNTDAGMLRDSIIRTLLFQQYEAEYGPGWPEDPEFRGKMRQLFDDTLDPLILWHLFLPMISNQDDLKVGGWPTLWGKQIDVPPGYEYVFQIPDLHELDWTWGTTMGLWTAVFYINQSVSPAEWAMFRVST